MKKDITSLVMSFSSRGDKKNLRCKNMLSGTNHNYFLTNDVFNGRVSYVSQLAGNTCEVGISSGNEKYSITGTLDGPNVVVDVQKISLGETIPKVFTGPRMH